MSRLLDVRHDPELRPILSAGLLLGAAVGAFAVTFGVGAVAAGASVAQACAMSLLVFTGASQFSAVSVVAAGGGTWSAVGGAMVLAARNGVYGLTLARTLDGPLATRLVAAQLVLDETTAITTAQPDLRRRRVAFWVTGVSLYVCWNLGTLVGALAGSAIDPATLGLDAAFPAAYVAMVMPHLRTRTGRLAAVLAAVICLALVPVLPVGLPILCASVAVLVGLRAPAETIPDGATVGVP
jgi:4-azaleucine resistance transporter AzlC